MEKHTDKITTIEDLAAMIQRTVVANMATKEDLQGVQTEMRTGFNEVNARLDHLDARVGRIEADIHELQEESVKRHEFEDALHRIRYMEKKLGIESGV
jgi:hypothetical protein